MGTLRAYGIVVPAAPDFQSIGAPIDAEFGVSVDRDRIVAGRLLDLNAPYEVTIGEGFAARLGLHVRDKVPAESYSPKQVAAILGGASDVGPRQGPPLQLRVVAIVRRPLDLGERGAAGGLMVLSWVFDRKYSDRVGIFGVRIRIRTEHGAGGRAAGAGRSAASPRRWLVRVAKPHDPVARCEERDRRVLRRSRLVDRRRGGRAGWRLLVIGIVLTREISAMTVDQDTLRGLGVYARCNASPAVLPATLLIAAAGAILAVIGAVAVSPRFPLGVAAGVRIRASACTRTP